MWVDRIPGNLIPAVRLIAEPGKLGASFTEENGVRRIGGLELFDLDERGEELLDVARVVGVVLDVFADRRALTAPEPFEERFREAIEGVTGRIAVCLSSRSKLHAAAGHGAEGLLEPAQRTNVSLARGRFLNLQGMRDLGVG